MAGLVVNLIRTSWTSGIVSSVEFYPFAMLGGAVWCIGNSMVVPIVKAIGLGLGMCIWGTTNLIVGWACGNFGLFGVEKESVSKPALNYVGVCFAILSVIVFANVKSETSENHPTKHYTKVLGEEEEMINSVGEKNSWIDKMSTGKKRIIGSGLAVFSGCCYGLNLTLQNTFQTNQDNLRTDWIMYSLISLEFSSPVHSFFYFTVV